MRFKICFTIGCSLFFISCSQFTIYLDILDLLLPILKFIGSFIFIMAFIACFGDFLYFLFSKEKRRQEKKEGFTTTGRIFISMFTISLFFGLSWWTSHSYFIKGYGDLEPYVDRYVNLCDRISETPPDSNSFSSLIGKLILIDRVDSTNKYKFIHFRSGPTGLSTYSVNDRTISILQEELPEELQAKKISEVGIIALLTWSENIAYNYRSIHSREYHTYQINCNVALYDKHTEKLISTKLFEGEYPPALDEISGSLNGIPPNEEIIKYLSSLPIIIPGNDNFLPE